MSGFIISMLWGIIVAGAFGYSHKDSGREANGQGREEREFFHIVLNFFSFGCWQVFSHERKC